MIARTAWMLALLLLAAVAAAACGSDPTPTPTASAPLASGADGDFQAELAALIAAAQAEGNLVIDADGGAGRTHGALVEEFG